MNAGAAGSDGSRLPTGAARDFMFATGIECSCPTIEGGKAGLTGGGSTWS